MVELVKHLVAPVVQHPDDVSVSVVEEGEAALILELSVHEDDHDRVDGERGRTLRAIRTVLSAAAGRKKATLDLVAAGETEDGDAEE